MQTLPWSLHLCLRAVQIPHLTALKRIAQILLLLLLTTLLLTIPNLNLNLISFCQTGRRIFFPNFIVQLMQIRYNYFIKQLFSAKCFLERSSQKSQ